MTHEDAMQVVAKITQETLRFLAEKHGVTETQISEALLNKNEKITAQWNELFGLAASAALA